MTALVVFPLLLGLLSGYFVTYLADALPVTRSLSRATCPRCQSPRGIKAFFLLRSCANCGEKRGWRPWIVLFLITGMTFFIWLNPPLKYGLWLAQILLIYFAVVTVIDLEHRLILHPVSLAGLFLGLIAGFYANGLTETLLGGLVGFSIMFLFYQFGRLFSHWRARRMGTDDGEEAFGFGDVALSAVLGLTLGWPLIWFGLLLGIMLSGLFVALLILGLLISGKYKSLTIFMPYGPFLIFGAVVLIYFPFLLNGLGAR